MSLSLKQNPALEDYQQYVEAMVKERGFSNDTPDKVFILINKEMGGLAQALRMTWGGDKETSDEQKEQISQQLADIFIYLLEFCNMSGISLEDAFRTREAENMQRNWKEYNFY